MGGGVDFLRGRRCGTFEDPHPPLSRRRRRERGLEMAALAALTVGIIAAKGEFAYPVRW